MLRGEWSSGDRREKNATLAALPCSQALTKGRGQLTKVNLVDHHGYTEGGPGLSFLESLHNSCMA